MAMIAIVGSDGAGKTTITRHIAGSDLPVRYLYMGVDIGASNVALPTSRLLELLGRRRGSRTAGPSPQPGGRKGPLGWVLLANRVAELAYRQAVATWYQLRGQVVLCDRHFVVDFAAEVVPPGPEAPPRRVWRWVLRRLCPDPDLVIFLDAPGEVLFARKGESTVEELDRRRRGFLEVGRRLPGFVTVDATRPLEEVVRDVETIVARVCARPAADLPPRPANPAGEGAP